MDCQDNFTEANFFGNLPEELFLPVVFGNRLKKNFPAYESTITLLNLRHVCKDLYSKVEKCWQAYIDQVGHPSLLLPSSLKIETGEHREIIIKQLPTLKNWIDTDPEVKNVMLNGYVEQCIVKNHVGNPELWIIHQPRNAFTRIDVLTQQESMVKLNEEVEPISFICHPCMIRVKECIAFCCDKDGYVAREIVVVQVETGK